MRQPYGEIDKGTEYETVRVLVWWLKVLFCGALLLCGAASAFSAVAPVVVADSAVGAGSLVMSLEGGLHSDTEAMFLVWVNTATNADQVASISIDNGIGAMSEHSQVGYAGTEAANVQLWYVAATINPATTYGITVTVSGSASKVAWAMLVTGDATLELIDVDGTINADGSTNPSVTMSHGGRDAVDCIGFHSGQADVANITPTTGWTSSFTVPTVDINTEHDFGARTSGCYATTASTTSDVAAGWTQASDDAAAIVATVGEVVGGSPPTRRKVLIGMGSMVEGFELW